jgi:hypothetical protein
MDLSNKPLDRWLCAEPLEGRWLLSGGAALAQFPGDHIGRGPLAVLEFEVAEEEPDEDVEIEPDELPAAVLDAFNAAFPDADISEAAREIEEGQVEYDVNAEVAGHEIDVSLTPDGRILEVEELLEPQDVPEQVLAVLRAAFGDPSIEEVSAVNEGGQLKVEFAFTTGADQPTLEATLGDPPVLANLTPPAPAALAGVFGDATAASAGADELLAPPLSTSVADAEQTSAPVDTPQETPPNPQDHAAAARQPVSQAILDALSNPAARAMQALAAGTGASVWLPQAADVIDDIASVDVAAVERRLQSLLNDIESATTKTAAQAASAGSNALPLAVAAAVLIAAQLVIIRLRLPNGGPILLFNSLNSSWSWILGGTGSERRRR